MKHGVIGAGLLSLAGKPRGHTEYPIVRMGPKRQESAESCGKSWKRGGSALMADESLGKQLETWDFT